MRTVAILFMVVGAFLFYGFRAAGVVMAQPLIGDIATEEERAELIATNGGLFPVTILILKKGYGFSDTGALLFSLVQFASSAIMSFVSGKISAKVGPRRTMILAYIMMLAIVALWVCIPDSGLSIMPLCAFLFMMGGAFRISIDNSVMHYFLQTVPAERRVASSMLLNMVTGVCAGVVGMVISGFILYVLGKHTGAATAGAEMLSVYRKYFALVFILLLPGLIFLTRLDPLPIEKRKIKRSWWHG